MKWTGMHRRVVSLEMIGYRPGEIAKMMELSESYVSVILNDPRAVVERNTIGKSVSERVTDVHLQLRLHAPEALKALVDTISSEDEKVKQRGAIALLDRAGYSKYQGDHVPKQVLSDAAAETILETMRELERANIPEASYRVIEADARVLESGEEDDADDT